MKKIIIIRHPETTQNKMDIQQTYESCIFSQEGTNQIKFVKDFLSQYNIEKIYSSDSPRCIKLMDNLNEIFNVECITTKLLRDKYNGVFEGKSNNEIDWTEINKMPFKDRKAPKGESLAEVKKRLNYLLSEIEASPEEIILVISHSTPIKVLIGILMNYSLEQSIFDIKINNCGISLLERKDKKMQIKYLNKTLAYENNIN